MDSGELQNTLKRLCKVMWEANVTNPITYVTQVSYLLFLKMLEEMDTEQKGNSNHNSLFGKFAVLHQFDYSPLVRRDSICGSEDKWDEVQFDVILENPPFSGDRSDAKRSLRVEKGDKYVLFLAHALRSLRPGGRAGIIFPNGILFGDSGSHIEVKRRLLKEFDLQAVVMLPKGMFEPYTPNPTCDWDTLRENIHANLAQNGFMAAFGHSEGPWSGNSIPYREDRHENRNGLMDYLKTKWLGRGWVHVSQPLRDAIVGKAWEIYANAFEHGRSPIGVFSCGQHYPKMGELKLTVVDFGVGIPSNVRIFKCNPNIPADKTLKWAFQRGTTTNPNGAGRGLGLDLLKGFIKINKGQLEIFSHEGYALINENRETYLNRQSSFEGTLVNITFRCDEPYYHLASETTDEPLF